MSQMVHPIIGTYTNDLCEVYTCTKYLVFLTCTFRFSSNVTFMITIMESRYDSKEISKSVVAVD